MLRGTPVGRHRLRTGGENKSKLFNLELGAAMAMDSLLLRSRSSLESVHREYQFHAELPWANLPLSKRSMPESSYATANSLRKALRAVTRFAAAAPRTVSARPAQVGAPMVGPVAWAPRRVGVAGAWVPVMPLGMKAGKDKRPTAATAMQEVWLDMTRFVAQDQTAQLQSKALQPKGLQWRISCTVSKPNKIC